MNLILLLLLTPPSQTEPQPTDVLLVVGDASTGVLPADNPEPPHPRVVSMDESGGWQPAVQPPYAGLGAGPEVAMAAAYAEGRPGVRVGLVPAAVENSVLADWQPGGEAAVRAVTLAKAAAADGTLRAIVWRGGGVAAGESTAYGEDLRSAIDGLRASLNRPRLPVVAVSTLPQTSAEDRRVDYELWTLPKRIVAAAYAGGGPPGDAAAVDALGRRAMAALSQVDADVEPPAFAVGPRFIDGAAAVVPPMEDGWVRHDLFVETDFDSDQDGRPDRLHVAVTRPKQTQTAPGGEGLKVPAVINFSPYFGRPDMGAAMWEVDHPLGQPPAGRTLLPFKPAEIERPKISDRHLSTWVPRGFAVVHASTPGTGLSQGCPTVGGENEYAGPAAVVDWLCGRRKGFTEIEGGEEVVADWCTGKIGSTGTSYNGTLALAAAMTGVDGLEAIIPVAPNTSYYRYYRSAGLVRGPGGYVGEDIDVLYEVIHTGVEAMFDPCNEMVLGKDLTPDNMDRTTGDFTPFWQAREMLPRMSRMKAAMLMSHGFNDWNVMPEHSFIVYQRAKELGIPAKLYMHQQGHGGPPPVEMMSRWFSHYLYGIDNGEPGGPKAHIVRLSDQPAHGQRYAAPTAYEDYPNPAARPMMLTLTPGAPRRGGLTAATTEKGNGATDDAGEPIIETMVDNASFDGLDLAKADWTDHRLAYQTDELSQPLHISGEPVVRLRVRSDRPAANLGVLLVTLPWDESRGASLPDNLVTRGWADPANAASLESEQPLRPDEWVDVTVRLQPDDQIIPAGKRLCLVIVSSDRAFTTRPQPGARIDVDLRGCRVTLPVVGGRMSAKQPTSAE